MAWNDVPRSARRFTKSAACPDRLDGPRSEALLLAFGGAAWGGEFDFFDVGDELAGFGVEAASGGGDGLDGVAIVEVVVGVDFDFDVIVGGIGGVAEDVEDLAVETLKCFLAATEVAIVEHERRHLAVGSGDEANLDVREQRLIGLRFTRGADRHIDVEVTFRCDDLQREHEEDQKLKNDVDHRRHLGFDFLRLAATAAEFHGEGLVGREWSVVGGEKFHQATWCGSL